MTGTGLPRPRADFNGRGLPIPWVAGDLSRGWAEHDPDRSHRMHHDVLCPVCGLSVTGRQVVLTRTRRDDDRVIVGPPTHPLCARIAVTHCPHFAPFGDDDAVGFEPVGDQGDPSLEFTTFDARKVTRAKLDAMVREGTRPVSRGGWLRRLLRSVGIVGF